VCGCGCEYEVGLESMGGYGWGVSADASKRSRKYPHLPFLGRTGWDG